jgi:oxalate---CoA ligase
MAAGRRRMARTATATTLSNPSAGLDQGFRFGGKTVSMAKGSPGADRHVWQLDVVRLMTFCAVIAVHAIAFTEPPSSAVAGGAMMLLQFGREVFFALSGFVLVYAARSQRLQPWRFWRRRVPLVAVPYAAWTVIYWLCTPGGQRGIGTLGSDLLDGNAEYHLYFLVVTLQLYIVFPWLLRFVRRTAGRAIPILAIVGILNLGWLAVLQYDPQPGFWWARAYELLPTYAIYVLAGCYAALHFERLHSWVMGHSRRLLVLAGAAAAVAEGAYLLQLRSLPPRSANAVLQPAMAASSVAALIVVYLIGARWAAGSRRHRPLVQLASEISFGVYLAHPLILQVLLEHGLGNGRQALPAPLATTLAFFGAAGGAALLCLIVRRTPLSLVLIGRRAAPAAHPTISSASQGTTMKLSLPADSTPVMSGNIWQLIQWRQATADQVAFVEGATGRTLTWRDVSDRSCAWRARADRVSERRIGLLFGDPLEMAAAVLGALSAGACAFPLDPSSTPAELAGQVKRLGLAGVVTDDASRQDITDLTPAGCLWPVSESRLVPDFAELDRPRGLEANGAALVLSSSGSTGAPKIVPLSESQLLHTARAVVTAHELTSADCGYSPLPLFHINGLVVGVLSTLVSGSRLVLDRRFSARSFWEVAARQQATWLNLVPAIITVLGNVPAPPLEVAARIAFARSASAPLPSAARLRFESHTGVGVLETYGMTEAGSQITANPRRADQRRPGSVGRPVGLELQVVNSDGRPVPPGAVGQIRIRGVSVTPSYWSPAGASAGGRPATDPDGWLATGDLGYLDPAGFLYVVGRADDVINRGGEKVYPREIEEVLLGDPEVVMAAVVGRPHPVLGEEPVAFVQATPGADRYGLAARLDDRCAGSLSRFRRPAAIRVAADLPAGPTGKVRRAELRQWLAAHAA